MTLGSILWLGPIVQQLWKVNRKSTGKVKAKLIILESKSQKRKGVKVKVPKAIGKSKNNLTISHLDKRVFHTA